MPVRKKLAFITIVYWFLLFYILAALVWWFIALNRQTNEMVSLKMSEINANDIAYANKVKQVEVFKKRKQTQYIGEGSIFLLLIGVGAIFVYRAIKKQWQLNEQQQNFMMAVTHELKTPIAIAKLNLETLRKRKLDDNKQQELLLATLEETERLNGLTSNILLASKMDGGEQEFFTTPIDFGMVVDEVVRQYKNRYANRVIETDIAAECDIKGDALLIRLLVSNLLDNAIKYAPATAPIQIMLSAGTYIILTVADQGPGIPENERIKIFEKFYRMGDEFTRGAKGTGLGLYLCNRIVKGHRGTIWVEDNSPKGSKFYVQFPVIKQ
jgi:signal transduction histidine kinase